MAFYDDMATVTTELLTEFGAAVTLTPRSGVSDPVTGLGGSDGTPAASLGLIRPYPDRVVDGTRILEGDRELVLDDSVVPSAGDRVTIGGEDWSIVGIKTIKPTDTVVAYFVQVRK